MKKKISLLLASAMTLSAVAPTTVFAKATNGLTQQFTALEKETMLPDQRLNVRTTGTNTVPGAKRAVEGTDLEVAAARGITSRGGSFKVNLENAKFYFAKGPDIKLDVPDTTKVERTFDEDYLTIDTNAKTGGTTNAVEYYNFEYNAPQEENATYRARIAKDEAILEASEVITDALTEIFKTAEELTTGTKLSGAATEVSKMQAKTTSSALPGTNEATDKAAIETAITELAADLKSGATASGTEETYAAIVAKLKNAYTVNSLTDAEVNQIFRDATFTFTTTVTGTDVLEDVIKDEVKAIATGFAVNYAPNSGGNTGELSAAESLPYRMFVTESDTSEMEILYDQQTDAYDPDWKFVIPMVVKTTADADVKLHITGGTSNHVTNTTHAISEWADGATTVTAKSVKEGRDKIALDTITVRENRPDVIKYKDTSTTGDKAKYFRITAPKGYFFETGLNKSGTTPTPANELNIRGLIGETITYNVAETQYNEDYQYDYNTEIYVSIERNGHKNKNVAGGFTIDGLVLVPDRDDEAYGKDLSITIEGVEKNEKGTKVDSAKIAKQSVKVAKRTDWVVGLEAKEAKEFFSGFRNEKVAKVTMDEKAVGAWLAQRETRFTLTDEEGKELKDAKISAVKLTGKDLATKFESKDGFGKQVADDDDFLVYTETNTAKDPENAGRFKNATTGASINIEPSYVSIFGVDTSNSKKGQLEVEFKISTNPGFEGPVYVKVGGRAIDGDIPAVKVADVKPVVKVTTKSTAVQIGYTNFDVASIEMTETKAGALKRGETIELGFKGDFVDDLDGIQFASVSEKDITVTGDDRFTYEVDQVGGTKKISLKVRRESEEPVTIKLDNLKVHIDRRIPQGDYDLEVKGSAIENVVSEQKFVKTTASTTDKADGKLNYDEYAHGILVQDYIKVATSGEQKGAKNNVKVQENSDVAIVNGKTEELGAATYIQGGSMMVPLRFVSVALGLDNDADILWDPINHRVTLFAGDRTIQFTEDSEITTVNGSSRAMVDANGNKVKAELTNARLYLPFRELANSLGIRVEWHADTGVAEYNPQSN